MVLLLHNDYVHTRQSLCENRTQTAKLKWLQVFTFLLWDWKCEIVLPLSNWIPGAVAATASEQSMFGVLHWHMHRESLIPPGPAEDPPASLPGKQLIMASNLAHFRHMFLPWCAFNVFFCRTRITHAISELGTLPVAASLAKTRIQSKPSQNKHPEQKCYC